MYQKKRLQRPRENSCHPATLEWYFMQILVNLEIFKLSLNLCLTHLRAHIACHEKKGDLSQVILSLKGNISRGTNVWSL